MPESMVLLDRLVREIPRRMKPKRISHTIAVAKVCASLCLRFGIDPMDGILAAYSHDLLKDEDLERQFALARRFDGSERFPDLSLLYRRIISEPAFSGKVVHGLASASYLNLELGLEDFPILEAVAFHSTGSLSMGKAAKILFIADKLEPTRPSSKPEDALALETASMDELLLLSLESSISYLSAVRAAIAQNTLDLYNTLRGKVGEK